MKGEDKEIFADVPVQDSMKEYDEGADITQGKLTLPMPEGRGFLLPATT